MHGFLGYPLAYAAILSAAGLGLWHKKWLHRAAMVLFAFAFAFFLIGFVPLLDALARVTATGPGLTGLVIAWALAVLGFAVEIRSKRKDARHLAHLCAGITAIATVMMIANAARLLKEAARSPREAGTALSRSVHSIASGRAAHAVNSHQALVDLGAAAVVLLILGMLMRRHEKKAPKTRAPLAITSGRPGPGTTGRPALPNARGR